MSCFLAGPESVSRSFDQPGVGGCCSS
jgi:hypothetical protein